VPEEGRGFGAYVMLIWVYEFAPSIPYLRVISDWGRVRQGCDFTNDLIERGLTPRLQEVLIPLKSLALGDEQLSEVLKTFIHGQQEALFSPTGERRRPGNCSDHQAARRGRAADRRRHLPKHKRDRRGRRYERPQSGLDHDQDGFEKGEVGKMGRRTVVWDESRMARIAMQYGIAMERTSRPETTAETSAMSANNTDQADVSTTYDRKTSAE